MLSEVIIAVEVSPSRSVQSLLNADRLIEVPSLPVKLMQQRQHKKYPNRCQCDRNRYDEVYIIFPLHPILQWILLRHEIALNKREMQCKRNRIHQNLSQEYIGCIR